MSNEKLQDILYAITHEFSAPLRHIREFSKRLVETMDEDATDKEKLYCDFIQTAVKKNETLLESLSEYSCAVFSPKDFVNISDVKKEVIDDVVADFKNHHVNFLISDAVIAMKADKKSLKKIFSNIVDNAIKFRQENIALTIQIGWKEKGEKTCFFIKDNGIGISEANYHSIFQLFKSLDPSKYQGRGVGLTIAKAIIEDVYHGTIWVESEIEKGSTLYFSI